LTPGPVRKIHPAVSLVYRRIVGIGLAEPVAM
jgi:hypothetical protein